MKVLIYKRTHTGDPDGKGIFGIQDCMGRMRDWYFDAVIGIGGKAPWKDHVEIKQKINWIGLGPKKISAPGGRGAMIVFDHFELFEEKGVDIEEYYPNLFDHMYNPGRRFTMSSKLPEEVSEEVKMILDSIKDCPPSPGYGNGSVDGSVTDRKTDLSKCGCPKAR